MTSPASPNSTKKREAALTVAREFITKPFAYTFTHEERRVLDCFFSSLTGRVFFVSLLPPQVIASLLSMYSRMANPRGLRGLFVDAFLPSVLAGALPEVQTHDKWRENPNLFLKEYSIKSLDDFINYSLYAEEVYMEFLETFRPRPSVRGLLPDSKKARRFIQTWLDKYGHNSIARMATVNIGIEGVSMLTAKSLEWGRPGTGYVELSSRYVNLEKAELYPIADELSGVAGTKLTKEIQAYTELLFQKYRELQGSKLDGYFPTFLRKEYGALFTEAEKDLEQGVFGECCDVGGNLLPMNTLTSLGIAVSGEAFPHLLKRLLLDGTAENEALVELIMSEAKKIGADQFIRHMEPTESEQEAWRYLETEAFLPVPKQPRYLKALSLPPQDFTETTLLQHFALSGKKAKTMAALTKLIHPEARPSSSFEKLGSEFETVTAGFSGTIPMRCWRDLQRMSFSTHLRTYLTPYLGFYQYDKPGPAQLAKDFAEVAKKGLELYEALKAKGASANDLQYILPIGFLLGFTYAANLRQHEFANWQRSKPDVNHSVRQTFLAIEAELRKHYPWWSSISRANTEPAFVFARGNQHHPLK